jgi:hypothetical protein
MYQVTPRVHALNQRLLTKPPNFSYSDSPTKTSTYHA